MTIASTPSENPQTEPSSDSEPTDRCTLPNGVSLCDHLWGLSVEANKDFDFGLDADGTVWWRISDNTGAQAIVEEGSGTWTSNGDQITITFTEVPSTFTTKTLSLRGTQEGLISNDDPPVKYVQTSG